MSLTYLVDYSYCVNSLGLIHRWMQTAFWLVIRIHLTRFRIRNRVPALVTVRRFGGLVGELLGLFPDWCLPSAHMSRPVYKPLDEVGRPQFQEPERRAVVAALVH